MKECLPNAQGFYGDFGGRFTDPKVVRILDEVKELFEESIKDKVFLAELAYYQLTAIGRPSVLYEAKNLTKALNGAKIYLKREDLNHTGSHKINNVIGQALLAKRLGKKRIIAETGAGQHGVATATACTLFGLDCVVYMGEEDMRRQALNVFRMELLGAKVIGVTKGTRTLKEAVDAALDDLMENYEETYYMLGSAVGPDPYPRMVQYFQSVIGNEAKKQILELEGKLPDYLVACVGGGSNAIGLFSPFYQDESVKMIGVEPAGKGLHTNQHAASLTKGTIGIIHGFKCKVLMDEQGEIAEAYSISAGLDYPGVGPEHCFYQATKRAEYRAITDQEAIKAFLLLSKYEGIIPAIESAHAIAEVIKLAPTLSKDKIIIVNLSGRGDKDVAEIARLSGVTLEK